MRRVLIALLPLALLVACRRPDLEAFGKNPPPIVVAFDVSKDDPAPAVVKSEYAAALRARLATCAEVVPANEPAPEPSAVLRAVVTRIRPHAQPSPAAIGTATGVAVGTLSAMAGNRNAFLDGLFWGLWAGSAAADSRDYEWDRLGYQPVRVSAVVTLEEPGQREPLLEFSVESHDVLVEMGYLNPGERSDEGRVREEEAKAFAKVVLARLREQFHWMPLSEPRYYKHPTAPATPSEN
jgi:hypothetical protein